MNQQAADKLSRARLKLILSDPYFATMALGLALTETTNPEITTAATDGLRIYYCPEFINNHNDLEVTALICHEVMHVTNLHHLRREGREHQKFNRACDFAINPIIEDCGYTLPKGGCIDPAYKGMSAEAIYNLLPDEPEGEKQPGFGDVMDAPLEDGNGDPISKEQVEQEVKQRIIQATQAAKSAGKIPGGLEEMINGVLNPVTPWRQVLARFMTDFTRDDYCFTKPNRRYLSTGFCLPSLYNEQLGNLYLFVDTSGSIDVPQLESFVNEIRGILDMFNKALDVLYIDTKVAGEQRLEPGDDSPLKVAGGGGTKFSPGFIHLEEQGIQPVAVLYFTDGWCNEFPEEPAYPVLWCLCEQNKNFNPPFGEIIQLDN